MAQSTNDYYLDLKIDDGKGLSELRVGQFYSLVIRESVGFQVPIYELQIKQQSYELLPYLRKVNLKATIKIGSRAETAIEYTILIINYSYTKHGTEFILSLTGIFDFNDMINTPRIRSIKGTSEKALGIVSSAKEVLVNYKGKDEQVWIQHGNSDLNFVNRIVEHAYCEPEDCILGCLTFDNRLIIKSIKTEFKSTPTILLSNEIADNDKDTIPFTYYKVESDSALWSSFFSEMKELPIISVIGRKPDDLKSTVNSPQDNQLNTDTNSNIKFPTVIDCGNCHDNYYKAYLNNLNYSTQLGRICIYVAVSFSYINNERVKLLDLVKFIPNRIDGTKIADPLSGKYIVTEKITNYSITGITVRLKLNRDFNLQIQE